MRKNIGHATRELYILEEHFDDVLRFHVFSVLDLFSFQESNVREIRSFFDQLAKITHENLKLMEPYVDER